MRRGETLAAIGRQLGLTRERVRQLRQQIEAEQGPILPPDWLTLSALCQRLRISRYIVHRLLRLGLLRPVVRTRQHFYFTPQALVQVRRILRAQKRRRCPNCGRRFTAACAAQVACSPACQRQQQQQQPPDGGAIRGWQQRLWQLLRNRPLPAWEDWIDSAEAVRRSGLSWTQLWWLRRREILRWRWSPDRPGRYLHAASEVLLAGCFWREEVAHRASAAGSR